MTYNPSPYQRPPENKGFQFMGYSIGIAMLLMIGIPLLLVLGCCGFFTFAAVNGSTTPAPLETVTTPYTYGDPTN